MAGSGFTPWLLFDDALYRDRHDSLVLQVGTEDPAHPVDNVRAYEPSIFSKASEAAATWRIGMGVGTPEPSDAVVVVGLPSDLVSVAYDFDFAGSPTTVPANSELVVAGASGKLLSYLRGATVDPEFVDVAVTAGSTGVFVGRIVIGTSLVLDGDLTNWEWDWIDNPSPVPVQSSGIVWTAEAVGRRLMRYTFEYLSETVAIREATKIYRKAGTWLPIALIEENEPELCVHGKLRRRPIVRQTGIYYQMVVEIEETAAG